MIFFRSLSICYLLILWSDIIPLSQCKINLSSLLSLLSKDETLISTNSQGSAFSKMLMINFQDLLSNLFSDNIRHIETMETEFIKLDSTILYVIKKIKNQHQRADIEHIFDEATKTIDFQHIIKDPLKDRVNQLLLVFLVPIKSNK